MIASKLFRQVNSSLPLRQANVSGNVHDWLIASSCFSGLLLLIRMIATDSLAYLFLPWNLFLAFIPYWITRWMMRNISIIENKVKLVIAITVWLLFIPNSFYMITDFFHLSNPGFSRAPKWFDLLLIFSFAWNGIVCGIISLRRLEVILNILRGKTFSLLFVFIVMWLNAFGIYIGRFLRFNSWEIITNPVSLVAQITDMIFHPYKYVYVWGMTLCYAVFMVFVYFTFKKIGDAIYFNKPV